MLILQRQRVAAIETTASHVVILCHHCANRRFSCPVTIARIESRIKPSHAMMHLCISSLNNRFLCSHSSFVVHKGMIRHRSYLPVKSTSVLVNVKPSEFVGVLVRDKTETRYKHYASSLILSRHSYHVVQLIVKLASCSIMYIFIQMLFVLTSSI
jgi:hypothetical protein